MLLLSWFMTKNHILFGEHVSENRCAVYLLPTYILNSQKKHYCLQSLLRLEK